MKVCLVACGVTLAVAFDFLYQNLEKVIVTYKYHFVNAGWVMGTLRDDGET